MKLIALVILIANLAIIRGFSVIKHNSLFKSISIRSFHESRFIGSVRSNNVKLNFKVSESERVDVDEDEEEIEFKSIDGSSLLKKISKGVVPIAASIGFAVSPSSSLAFRIAGATIGGLGGFLTKKFVIDKILNPVNDDDNSSNLTPFSTEVSVALATLLSNPKVLSMSLKDIENIAKKCKVKSNELGFLMTYLLADILYMNTLTESKDLTELVDIIDFVTNIEFTPAEIADAFSLAAIKVGKKLTKDERGFFIRTPNESKLLLQSSKLFFLGDKLIGVFEGYFGKRFATVLYHQFPKEEYRDLITSISRALYKRCVENVILNPKSFSIDEVNNLRDYLTTSADISSFRPANMQNMILEAINYNIDIDLKNTGSADDVDVSDVESDVNAVNPDNLNVDTVSLENYSNLQSAQQILGWNQLELQNTIELKTLPLFEKAAKSAVNEIFKHGASVNTQDSQELIDKYENYFIDRMNSLHINARKARVIITNIISDINKEYMTSIDKVYSISKGNLLPVYKLIVSYAKSYDILEKVTKPVMEDVKIPIPGLPFADIVRANLYELSLKTAGNKAPNDELFDLSERQQLLVKRSIALPKVSSWILQCIAEGNFEPTAKSTYQKLLNQYDIVTTSKAWINTAIDFYYQQVNQVANSRAIPTADDLNKLNSIRDFLDCSDEDLVSKVHMELFGDKYVKALEECMTPTGVIAEDYIVSLDRLRVRLGLSDVAAQSLLALAVRKRLIPTVKSLLEQYKSSTDPKKVAEKQAKRLQAKQTDMVSSLDTNFNFIDPMDDELDGVVGVDSAQKTGGGPNVFMREALNMIDLYQENFKAIMEGQSLSVSGDLPVRATGIIPEKDLFDLMKHYIITRLTERDEDLRARYLANEEFFAEALGIPQESLIKVKESLAFSANKRIFSNILATKDAMSPSDIQQFASIKDSLKIDNAVYQQLNYNSSRLAVLEHGRKIFGAPAKGTITAAIASRFRQQVTSIGLDFQKDIGFNVNFISYLYALEVANIINSGEDTDLLQEAQEAYGIPEEQAKQIIEAAAKRYVSQLLNLALRAAKKYDEIDSLKWMNQIIKYSQFISDKVDCDGSLFSEKDKDRLLNYYMNSVNTATVKPSSADIIIDSTTDESVVEEPSESTDLSVLNEKQVELNDSMERLRRLIHLSNDYVAPLSGIEGLLGGLTNVNDLMIADPSENRKRWAWG